MTRAAQQAQTRARLLCAAREEFEARGFTAATLDQICDRAGYSRTAIYKHFSGKEELLLEVIEQEATEQVTTGGAALADEHSSPVEAFVQWFGVTGERAMPLSRATAEFVLSSSSDPAMRERFVRLQRAADEGATQIIGQLVRRLGVRSKISDSELAVMVMAVAQGLALRKAILPGFDADGAFRSALAALLGASTAQMARPHVSPRRPRTRSRIAAPRNAKGTP